MKVVVIDTVPDEISSSIHYSKIKHALHAHIISFCREKKELKDDLKLLSYGVGREYDYDVLINVMESLKEKYNDKENNVGIDYHIEFTRYDFALIVNVIIKRQNIELKKFIFRYKKKSTSDSMLNVNFDRENNSEEKENNQVKNSTPISTISESKNKKEDILNDTYDIIRRRIRRGK